jgi:hypothetical protein
VKAVALRDESIGLGDGSFLESKAVDPRLGFTGGFHVVQTGPPRGRKRAMALDPAAGEVPRVQGRHVPDRRLDAGADPVLG